jgi:hypothetical protein
MASFAEAPEGDIAKGTSARESGSMPGRVGTRQPRRTPHNPPAHRVPIFGFISVSSPQARRSSRPSARSATSRRRGAGTSRYALCLSMRHRTTLHAKADTRRKRADDTDTGTDPRTRNGTQTRSIVSRGHCSAFTAVSSRRKRFLFFQSFRVAPILTPHPPPPPQPGPQPGRPFRPRQRHNGGVRVQRREQKQRRQVGNRHPLRLPVEPEEVHPGNEDGFRGAEKTAGQGRPHRVPRR